MDVVDSQANNSNNTQQSHQQQFSEFRQPVSPTLQSPSARHLHSRSSESALSSFYHDMSSPTSSRFAESAIPFVAASSTGIPNQLSTDHHSGLSRQPLSFTSPRYASSPPSGFDTPATPSEHHQSYAPLFHGLPSEPAQHATFSASQLIVTGILDGIEASIRAAREAVSNGDVHAYQSRIRSVISSADLLRGFNDLSNDADSSFAESINFDAIDLGLRGPNNNSGLPPEANPVIVTEHSPNYPLEPPHEMMSYRPLNSHAFAQGLALLDPSDSRKRTISTATARAGDTDRAAKAQKLTPVRQTSLSDVFSYESISTSVFNNPQHDDNQSQLQAPHSENVWFDFLQDPNLNQPTTVDPTQNGAFGGSVPVPAPTPAPQQSVPEPGVPSNQPPSAPATPHRHGRNHSAQMSASRISRQPRVRQSRSSSYSSAHPSMHSYPVIGTPGGTTGTTKVESSHSSMIPSRPPSPDHDDFTESDPEADWEYPHSRSRRSSHGAYTDASPSRPSRRNTGATNGGGDAPAASNLVSPAQQHDLDRIFDMYLQQVCSNLDATDSKGELIHQALMPKKMAKMDESDDFRPFKFRIQAFTNAFIEMLSQHQMGEDVIPPKKVKAYLWHQQPLISRFNDDGKKSKSKGNHVWHICARRDREKGCWIFRPFERRIAGNPPPVAYVGLNWAWQPRIWDPQIPSQNIIVAWSSPSLPPWLSWQNGVLMGVPGSGDLRAVDLTIEATFPAEERGVLTTSFHLQVSRHTVGQEVRSNAKSLRVSPPEEGRRSQSLNRISPVSVPHSVDVHQMPHHSLDPIRSHPSFQSHHPPQEQSTSASMPDVFNPANTDLTMSSGTTGDLVGDLAWLQLAHHPQNQAQSAEMMGLSAPAEVNPLLTSRASQIMPTAMDCVPLEMTTSLGLGADTSVPNNILTQTGLPLPSQFRSNSVVDMNSIPLPPDSSTLSHSTNVYP